MGVRLFLILVLLVLAGGYLGWPYYTLYRIDVALAGNDTATLDRLVDWGSVRAGVERELAARNVSPEDTGAGASGERPGGLAGLVVPRFGQMLVDAYASPRGLARLVRDARAAPPAARASARAGAGTGAPAPFRPALFEAISYARDKVAAAEALACATYRRLRDDYDYLFFTDPFTFQARYAPRAADQTEPLILTLRFQNLVWRLDRVDLPSARAGDGG